ncbi:hypothetical protein HN51_034481 [Arachis hypogaea]|uniref:Uncharacterized protein n=1 Tax=Arachis hypogaea TaxID=3818 RepID=A0A445A870_ARAHY|nr:myb-related protein 308 [Arachis ipaensis]XP_025642496.1 myb-related protein 308 [Arachis hypogaea]QHN99322.1 Transcription repressor [Arachis hypogaea]RYR22644.1 hypothetical protein Ahy_B03g067954 [Arachis hypogaea]
MGRSPCCEKAHTNKGAWTKEEDDRLISYIRAHGEGCWRSLPKAAGLLRCGKSCRLRWINYLRPDLKRGNFTEEEDELIIKLHSLLGNKWSLIAGRLPGRTDNEIKNYWNTHIRRKLLSRGIDPATHRPLNDSSASHHHHNNQEQQQQQQQQQPSSLVAAATTTTISFASSVSASASAVKQEQDTITTTTATTTTSATCNANMFGIMEKKNKKDYSKGSSMERCPDLNLELTISPPRHLDEPDHQKFSGIERSPCFVCSLGLQNSKDCRCGFATNANANGGTNSNGTTTTTTTATGSGYDFLGLKTGSVWDYRSLEMK